MARIFLLSIMLVVTLVTTAAEPRFVLSVLAASGGRVYAGTEGEGLFFKEQGSKDWIREDAFDIIGGTNVFALTEDASGRIWAGTLDRGVLVWDGTGWNRISIEEGLAGSRVFALAADSKGRVWVATDGGLCLVDEQRKSISIFTRASGLPENEVSSLAIADNGDVLAGTFCHGLVRSAATDLWKRWLPVETSGVQINAINNYGDGKMVLASNEGVEWSTNGGRSWSVVTHRRSGEPKPLAVASCSGRQFVGFEENGVRTLKHQRECRLEQVASIPADDRITCLSAYDATLVAGTYGKGVRTVFESVNRKIRKRSIKPVETNKSFQVKWQDPSRVKSTANAYYLKDDWETKGDWCGRYGLRAAVLCAQHAQYGDEPLLSDHRYNVSAGIGENHRKGEALRGWLHWKTSSRIDSLYNPLLGVRRQAEWDDHSETYPQSFEGPDLKIDMTVPSGWQEVSLYFFNKDGETGNNFRRDYLVSLEQNGSSEVELARSRVFRFRNGVYKRFVVRGPGKYTLRINRGNSFSTILSGVFVSRVVESVERQQDPRISTCLYYGGLVYREPADIGHEFQELSQARESCNSPIEFDRWQSRLLTAFRTLKNGPNDPDARWARWMLHVWDAEERYRFGEAMLSAWTCRQMKSPHFKKADLYPDSPNVLKRPITQDDYSVESPLAWINDPAICNRREVLRMDSDFYLKVVNKHGSVEFMGD